MKLAVEHDLGVSAAQDGTAGKLTDGLVGRRSPHLDVIMKLGFVLSGQLFMLPLKLGDE